MPEYAPVLSLSDLDGNNGFRINGEALNDHCGSFVSAGDINGDGFSDLIVAAHDADPNGSSCGASYVVFGKASGFEAELDLATLDGTNGFQINGEASYDHSRAASAGDINGDGFDDVIVGAPDADPNDSYSGASYVVFGKASGFDGELNLSTLDGNNGFQVNGEGMGYNSGFSVSRAGDFNGDGFEDLIVGAPFATPSGSQSGASYLIFGQAAGFGAELNLSTLDGANGFTIEGEAASDRNGVCVSSAGDVNGDGIDDIVIGAEGSGSGGQRGGYVVFGTASPLDAAFDLLDLDGSNGFEFAGSDLFTGCSVSHAGDVNADGFADIIVGSPFAESDGYEGASYVVLGKSAGFPATIDLAGLDGTNGFRIRGDLTGSDFGRSVASAGDVNGDGFDDIVVADTDALNSNDDHSGVSYVIFGRASFAPLIDVPNLDGTNGFRIEVEEANDWASSVSSAGDVNADGFGDLIVGSLFADTGNTNSGASYVIFGSMPNEAVTRVGTAIDNIIHGGDFDDTLVGLNGNDQLYGHAGNDLLNAGAGGDTLSGATGNDTLVGGNGKDDLSGAGGTDTLTGSGGKDSIDGGTGVDTFVYGSVIDSTSTNSDTVKSADFTADTFDLTTAVAAIDAAVGSGMLRKNHFDGDLAAAVGGGQLGAGHAVLFTPDDGRLAGRTFLVIDANGTAGYQAGEDLVMQIMNAQNLVNLGIEDFI